MHTRTFAYSHPFPLESGRVLHDLRLAYTTHGTLSPQRDNVLWVFHALTANSDPAEWWPGLVGEGRFFDPAEWYIVCVNMPGSCYGSTGPLDLKPGTDDPYYHDFPFFTPRDMARAYHLLAAALGIDRIRLGIGGSMGGQQLLEWAVEEPQRFEHIVPIATNAFHSAWGRAFNASQRMCIEADPTWRERRPEAGIEGMKTARSIALISYRHYRTYAATQQDPDDRIEGFRSESYQRYQGEKLAARFNAFSYHALSRGMDAHNLARARGTMAQALGSIRARTLVVGIDTDILFPPQEQEYLARLIPGAGMEVITSEYGHDGFLLEYGKLESVLRTFLGARASG